MECATEDVAVVLEWNIEYEIGYGEWHFLTLPLLYPFSWNICNDVHVINIYIPYGKVF